MKQQNKVNQVTGTVTELFLFHGSTETSIESIVKNNFDITILPNDGVRKKNMLFGTGFYFSELPYVSLVYGSALLLCKVLIGSYEEYLPNGSTPPEIPDQFDSRIVIKDGIKVVHCIKKPEQILPYAIINLRKDFLTQNFVIKNNQVPQDQGNNYNEDIGFENLRKNRGV